jgi:hypothetical protein
MAALSYNSVLRFRRRWSTAALLDMNSSAVAVIVGFWIIINGGIGVLIGQGKGRSWLGFWLGFLIGPIGWIIVAVIEPSQSERERRTQRAELVALRGQHRASPPQPLASPPAPSDSKQCPMCAETVLLGAKICRYCRHDFAEV